MPAVDIDDVVRILDNIIDTCRRTRDPLGYFPALYRPITVKMKVGIASGIFDDGARMNRFDTAFANRYLAAYDAFRAGEQPSQSWAAAFSATQSDRLIILQDLLVGINAHINFDLGVAAAEMFSGASLQAFRNDFDRINDILAATLPQVEATVDRFSPVLKILAEIGGKPAIDVLDFSMTAARADAWLHATLLSDQPPVARAPAEQILDDKVAFLGKVVAQPAQPVAAAVSIIRDRESDDVPSIIDALLAIA